MSDWLDEFRFAGAGLNEGEKSLMRFAMTKERQRIIKLIKDDYAEVAKRNGYQFLPEQIEWLENLIKREQK